MGKAIASVSARFRAFFEGFGNILSGIAADIVIDVAFKLFYDEEVLSILGFEFEKAGIFLDIHFCEAIQLFLRVEFFNFLNRKTVFSWAFWVDNRGTIMPNIFLSFLSFRHISRQSSPDGVVVNINVEFDVVHVAPAFNQFFDFGFFLNAASLEQMGCFVDDFVEFFAVHFVEEMSEINPVFVDLRGDFILHSHGDGVGHHPLGRCSIGGIIFRFRTEVVVEKAVRREKDYGCPVNSYKIILAFDESL